MGAPDQNGPEGGATGGSPATECGPATARSPVGSESKRYDNTIATSIYLTCAHHIYVIRIFNML
jgi:hypothetical protein